jgi:hypothetical protein
VSMLVLDARWHRSAEFWADQAKARQPTAF